MAGRAVGKAADQTADIMAGQATRKAADQAAGKPAPGRQGRHQAEAGTRS